MRQRRLAGSILAEQAECLPNRHHKVNSPQDVQVAIMFLNIGDFDCVIRGCGHIKSSPLSSGARL